ncbi:MAG: right-handed parallel beta-helix repeat-containing protein [Planctomycetes bacterium]|nr:right-handed parallel beta-helix repeat-containing protein [Planctomycetota bacterium]
MKSPSIDCVVVCSLLLAATCGVARSMTIQLGPETMELVSPGDTWAYFPGKTAPSTPAGAWKEPDFDDSAWLRGDGGFGYGDNDDATILNDMEGSYVSVYIRKAFNLDSVPQDRVVELLMDYDDGFVAYLNGREVAWTCVPAGELAYDTLASSSHEADKVETFVLGNAADLFRQGRNVLAVEGHNIANVSTDFSLTPALRMPPVTGYADGTYYVTTQMVTLTGHTSGLNAVQVKVDDLIVDVDPVTHLWTASLWLSRGQNLIPAYAYNAAGTEVDAGEIKIDYTPPNSNTGNPTTRVTGGLTQDTILSGTCEVTGTVTVPAGVVLTILPGTTLQMNSGAAIVVEGRLVAEGAEESPIRFTRSAAGVTWKQIKFIEAEDSRFAWCTFEYADSEGEHQDYYEPGPRKYHEAVVAVACHLDFQNCTFQKLPDDSAGAEGDAIAIFSDDPDHPGEASAHIAGCQFLKIGQGVHERYSYVCVENSYFTGKRGDNDDVDLWGESTPPPLIRNNTFANPEHDDMVNPTRCSARIIGNLILGSDDHGLVLRDKGSPLVANNLIIDCANGGIAVENSCTATLINNTIVNCGRGIRMFDLGRAGPPYYLTPGGGTATITNCIIWNCTQSITLADSSNTAAKDRGSHVTINYCDIQGGQSGISNSGKYSTVTWGKGNLDTDPLFADAKTLDFHLQSPFGRWDAVPGEWVNDAVTSPCIDAGDPNSPVVFEPFPNGNLVNMGAYGNSFEASRSTSGPASGTSRYAFLPDLSAILQTGGFAGVHWTYRVEGQFDLTVHFQAGAASLSDVDAVATDNGTPPRTLDPNEVFNLTALAGTVGRGQTVTFTGKAPDGSDVELTLTFIGNLVHLVGGTTPPAGSADMFVFGLDAWAKSE